MDRLTAQGGYWTCDGSGEQGWKENVEAHARLWMGGSSRDAGRRHADYSLTSVSGTSEPSPPTATVHAWPPARSPASSSTISSPAFALPQRTRAAHRPVTPLPTMANVGITSGLHCGRWREGVERGSSGCQKRRTSKSKLPPDLGVFCPSFKRSSGQQREPMRDVGEKTSHRPHASRGWSNALGLPLMVP